METMEQGQPENLCGHCEKGRHSTEGERDADRRPRPRASCCAPVSRGAVSFAGSRALTQCLLAVLALLGGAFCLSAAGDQVQTHLASAVKAAYIYNFMQFVEWPIRGFVPTSIILGVLGEDSVAVALAAVQGRQAQGKAVEVRHLASVGEAANCHVVYVGSSETSRYLELLRPLKDASVLTVGDTPDFLDRGGMVGFFLEDGKVRFRICASRAARRGLKLSARLLEVARVADCPGP